MLERTDERLTSDQELPLGPFYGPHEVQGPEATARFPSEKLRADIDQQIQELSAVMDARASGPKTLVVVSSLTFAPADLENIVGVVHYESRGLWEVLEASDPQVRVVYVTSVPVGPEAYEHLLSFTNRPEEIKKRVVLLSLNDPSAARSLTEKLLDRQDLLERIKNETQGRRSYLVTFIASQFEAELSRKLELPLFGPHEGLAYLQSKTGNRRLFACAGVPYVDGEEGLHTEDDVISAATRLWARCPAARRMVIKTDLGVSGDGNAIMTLPCDWRRFVTLSEDEQRQALEHSLDQLVFRSSSMSRSKYFQRLLSGGVLEVFIEGENKLSPSAQGLILPDGSVELFSTHEQLLDGRGMAFLGSVFPAAPIYRHEIQRLCRKVGQMLGQQGVIGTFAVDFLWVGDEASLSGHLYAIEVNVRRGGTTHPYQTARLLTGASFDEESGFLVTEDGHRVCYVSNDNIMLEGLKGARVEEFLSFMQKQGIVYSPQRREGLVFHLLGALSEYGKLGHTAIADSAERARQLDEQALALIRSFAYSRGKESS